MDEDTLRRRMAAAAEGENKRLRAVLRANLPPDACEAWERRKALARAERLRARAVALYRDGVGMQSIARQLRRSSDWVRKVCVAAGCEMRDSAAARAARRARIEALAAEGQTARQIAADVGLTPDGVRINCRKWGVPLARARKRGARS